MLFWMYDALLLASLPFLLPFFKARALFKNKRAPFSFFQIPKFLNDKPVLWIHAVSLGEVNTVKPLLKKFKQHYPGYKLAISVVTETGFLSASSIDDAFVFYLPLDLSFLQKALVERLHPKLFVYVEGDIWPNLTRALKSKSVPVCIMSAKLSQKSLKRLKKLSFVTKCLFDPIDQIFCQDEEMKDRFTKLGISNEKLCITGNLKLTHAQIKSTENRELLKFLKLDESKKTIVIGSTHKKEELLILNALKEDLDDYNIILAPRHPQRFEEVKKDLESLSITYSSFTKENTNGGIFLIDAIGHLKDCYKMADVAVLGGSFIKGIGGHNVMEPIFEGIPVIVGPYAFSQKSLVDLIIKKHLGTISQLENLLQNIEILSHEKNIHERIKSFTLETKTALEDSYKGLERLLF